MVVASESSFVPAHRMFDTLLIIDRLEAFLDKVSLAVRKEAGRSQLYQCLQTIELVDRRLENIGHLQLVLSLVLVLGG